MLALVDGTYELFRAYYGAPSARGPDGGEVGATRGLLRSLYALTRTPGLTHVGVAFDTVIESFRNDLFPGYKTGAGLEPALWAQFPLAERVSEALGFVTWRMREFEADDALATAAARFRDDAGTVWLASPDKDLAQCVRGSHDGPAPKVLLWGRKDKWHLDEAGVLEKFGVPPASIPHWLGLVGDTADGIPGVPKWGPKSAATLLQRWQTTDAIPDDPEVWDVTVRGAASLASSLRAHRHVLPLYVRLATLREDVPLTEQWDDLRWRGPRPDLLSPLVQELGDERFSLDA